MASLLPIEKDLLGPYMMVFGLIGFVMAVIFTAGGNFSEWFNTTPPETGEFDFGTNLGVALSVGFLIIFVASILQITPSMIEREFD